MKKSVSENKPILSFGCELEWGDIDRSVDIPKELGSWEGPKIAGYYMGSEPDVINSRGIWKNIACDPLCRTCPVGGEIHVAPSTNIEVQLNRIMELMNIFPEATVNCSDYFHIHVGIPGIKNYPILLKNIFEYVELNEKDAYRSCLGWNKEVEEQVLSSRISEDAKELMYANECYVNPKIYEGVKQSDSWLGIYNVLSSNYPAYHTLRSTGELPIWTSHNRTGINLWNLKDNDTLEFRIFRSTLNPVEMYSCLKFVETFVTEALEGSWGKPVSEFLLENNFRFPVFNFDEKVMQGWDSTRHKNGRGDPFKRQSSKMTVHDKILTDYSDIVDMCRLDFLNKEWKGTWK